jgi:hypothetical protein
MHYPLSTAAIPAFVAYSLYYNPWSLTKNKKASSLIAKMPLFISLNRAPVIDGCDPSGNPT